MAMRWHDRIAISALLEPGVERRNGLASALHVELLEQVRHVGLHRTDAEGEAFCDVLVGQTLGDQGQDFELPLREAVGQATFACRLSGFLESATTTHGDPGFTGSFREREYALELRDRPGAVPQPEPRGAGGSSFPRSQLPSGWLADLFMPTFELLA